VHVAIHVHDAGEFPSIEKELGPLYNSLGSVWGKLRSTAVPGTVRYIGNM